MDSHTFLRWLRGCDSRDEMHAAIAVWLREHPQSPDDEIGRVRAAALDHLAGYRVDAWLDTVLAEYGRTPRQLVNEGRCDTVLTHIGQFLSGSSG